MRDAHGGVNRSFMSYPKLESRRHFTEAARTAAVAARAAKRASPSTFGHPELFVVRAPSGAMAFTWEIRRHGGVLLQKGLEGYASMVLAKAEGERAMTVLSELPE